MGWADDDGTGEPELEPADRAEPGRLDADLVTRVEPDALRTACPPELLALEEVGREADESMMSGWLMDSTSASPLAE